MNYGAANHVVLDRTTDADLSRANRRIKGSRPKVLFAHPITVATDTLIVENRSLGIPTGQWLKISSSCNRFGRTKTVF
jgi:hypothetical protein